jgi:hypothetical protein
LHEESGQCFRDLNLNGGARANSAIGGDVHGSARIVLKPVGQGDGVGIRDGIA